MRSRHLNPQIHGCEIHVEDWVQVHEQIPRLEMYRHQIQAGPHSC